MVVCGFPLLQDDPALVKGRALLQQRRIAEASLTPAEKRRDQRSRHGGYASSEDLALVVRAQMADWIRERSDLDAELAAQPDSSEYQVSAALARTNSGLKCSSASVSNGPVAVAVGATATASQGLDPTPPSRSPSNSSLSLSQGMARSASSLATGIESSDPPPLPLKGVLCSFFRRNITSCNGLVCCLKG